MVKNENKGECEMKRFLVLVIVFCVAMVSAAYAADEAIGFKEFILGSDLKDIQKNDNLICKKKDSPLYDTMCQLKQNKIETIAKVPIDELYLFFYNDKLWQIWIKFKKSGYDSVKKALVEKYGKGAPGSGKFGDFAFWKKGTISISSAQQSGDSMLFSAVVYSTQEGNEIYKQRSAAQTQKQSKDM